MIVNLLRVLVSHNSDSSTVEGASNHNDSIDLPLYRVITVIVVLLRVLVVTLTVQTVLVSVRMRCLQMSQASSAWMDDSGRLHA